MAVEKYSALATITLGAAQTTVTFSSLPSTGYRDLRLVINGKSVSSAVSCLMTINGNVSSNAYQLQNADGNGSVKAAGLSNNFYGYIGYNYGLVGNTSPWIGTADFLDYSQTNKQKMYIARYASGVTGTGMLACRISVLGTTAITSIALTPNGDQWAAGSTFTIYGVK